MPKQLRHTTLLSSLGILYSAPETQRRDLDGGAVQALNGYLPQNRSRSRTYNSMGCRQWQAKDPCPNAQ